MDFTDNRSKREIQRERAALGRERKEIRRLRGLRTAEAKLACARRREALAAERDDLREELRSLAAERRTVCRTTIEERTAEIRERLREIEDEIERLREEEEGAPAPVRRELRKERAELGRERVAVRRELREETAEAKAECGSRKEELLAERDEIREQLRAIAAERRTVCRTTIAERIADLEGKLAAIDAEIELLHAEESQVYVPPARRKAARQAAELRWDREAVWWHHYLYEIEPELHDLAREVARKFAWTSKTADDAAVAFSEWVEQNTGEVAVWRAERAEREAERLIRELEREPSESSLRRRRGGAPESTERRAIMDEGRSRTPLTPRYTELGDEDVVAVPPRGHRTPSYHELSGADVRPAPPRKRRKPAPPGSPVYELGDDDIAPF